MGSTNTRTAKKNTSEGFIPLERLHELLYHETNAQDSDLIFPECAWASLWCSVYSNTVLTVRLLMLINVQVTANSY